MSGKGEIEKKLDDLINKIFGRFGLDANSDSINRENAAIYMQELMNNHGQGPNWSRKEFDKVFNLFEEDDPNEVQAAGSNNGLDKGEMLKLVKRIAQL